MNYYRRTMKLSFFLPGFRSRIRILLLSLVFTFLFCLNVQAQGNIRVDSLLLRLEQIASSDSATAKIHNNLGLYYLNFGRFDDAIKEYKKAIEMDAGFAEVHNNLGYAYSLKGNIANAVRSYQQALRLDPAFADAYNNIGMILMNQNKIQEALLQFRQAIAAKPDYYYALGNLGFAYFKVGRLDSAIALAQRAVEIQPDFGVGYNIIGLAYYQQGKGEEAVEQYRRAVKVNPGFADARYNLGMTLSSLKQYDEATRELEILVQNNPSEFFYAYQLALLYFNTMKLDKADRLTQQIVRADSTFVEGFLLMGRIEKGKGNTKASRENFLHAAALNPKLADPWYNLGVLDLNAEVLVAAEKELLKAKELAPDRREVNYALGLIYLTMQEPEWAAEAFRQELERFPDFQQASQGLEQAQAMAEHFKQSAEKGQIRARIIIVKTKKEADRIMERLKAGEQFRHLAFNNSMHPSFERGGDVGFLDPDDIQPELAKQLNKASVGAISPVIPISEGFQIIQRLN